MTPKEMRQHELTPMAVDWQPKPDEGIMRCPKHGGTWGTRTVICDRCWPRPPKRKGKRWR